MEALLSRGNIISTPVSAVKPVDSQQLVSETPFLAPATRPTGPVKVPVAIDAQVKDEQKSKKKSHKSRKEDSVSKDSSTKQSAQQSDKKHDSKTHRKRDRSKSPVSKKASVNMVSGQDAKEHFSSLLPYQ